MIVLTISDIMTLNFFYLVRDEGSWLDIGTSISHFTISNLLILFVIALEQLSEVLTTPTLFTYLLTDVDKIIISGAVVSLPSHESKWE
jgi:Phosphatidylinositolglycan class N (PIG-N)